MRGIVLRRLLAADHELLATIVTGDFLIVDVMATYVGAGAPAAR
jgi:hypothetical protein